MTAANLPWELWWDSFLSPQCKPSLWTWECFLDDPSLFPFCYHHMSLNKAVKDSGLLGCRLCSCRKTSFLDQPADTRRGAASGTDGVARGQVLGLLALWAYTPVYVKAFPWGLYLQILMYVPIDKMTLISFLGYYVHISSKSLSFSTELVGKKCDLWEVKTICTH